MTGKKTLAEIAREIEMPEPTARRYATRHKLFFVTKTLGRRKLYEDDAGKILQHIGRLYGEGLEAPHVEEVLRQSMPERVTLEVRRDPPDVPTIHAAASGLAIPSEFMERIVTAFERHVENQARHLDLIEDRLAALEASRTPQDRRKPLPATRRPSEAPTARTSRPDALNLVLELHREGLGSRAIARRLNDSETPTISGRGVWARGIVQKLLAEAGER